MQIELERIGSVLYYPERIWETEICTRTDLDPLNHHKPYGILVPQLVDSKWTTAISAAHVIKPLEGYDDDDLNRWIEYWLTHLALHVVIRDWEEQNGNYDITEEEEEREVDKELEEQGSDLFAFGEYVKSLSTK